MTGINPKESKTILVAKKTDVDYSADDPDFLLRDLKPLTLINQSQVGPRKASDGNWIPHSVLGEVEDYEEMEQVFCPKPKEVSAPLQKELSKSAHKVHFQIDSDEKSARLLQIDKLKKIQDRKKKMNQMHIFQRFREVREEHALKNWQRHSVEWQKMEKIVSKKSNKSTDQLLMARLGEYRQIVEEKELIEEALMMLEHKSVNFWKTGMRIGNDLLGLTLPMPRGGPREVERLRTVESKDFNEHKLDYRSSKREQLQHIISALDPFYGRSDGGYVEVVGRDVSALSEQKTILKEYVERLDTKYNQNIEVDNQKMVDTVEYINNDSKPSNQSVSDSLKLVLPISRLSFETVLNEVSVSVISLYNKGNVPIFFEWEPKNKPVRFKAKTSDDGIQRFYFNQKKGVIQPDTAFDFVIVFKSCTPGIFTELWQLRTHPELPNESELVATFQGTAIEEDINAKKRQEIEKKLGHKEALKIVSEIIESIMRNMNLDKTDLPLSQKKNPDLTLFEWSNRELSVIYTPAIFAKFEDLAREVYTILGKANHYWNRSIMTLYEHINHIFASEKRSSLLLQLNELIKLASEPLDIRAGNSLLYMICHDIIVELLTKISDISILLRKRRNLPLARGAMKFFEDDQTEEKLESSEDGKKSIAPGTIPSAKGPPTAAAINAKDAKTKTIPPPATPIGKAIPVPDASKKHVPGSISTSINKKNEEGEEKSDQSKLRRVPSFKSWSKERAELESDYKSEFTSKVKAMVESSLERLIDLLGETETEHEKIH